MKILNMISITLIALLSVAAGFAKVMGAPQEVAFLQSFGFTSMLIIAYGSVQIAGGILLAIPNTKKLGAMIAMLAFGLSTVLIFISGNLMFGFISLFPILLACFIFWQSSRIALNESLNHNL